MELSELRNLYDQARMAGLDTEREYHQDMLAYRFPRTDLAAYSRNWVRLRSKRRLPLRT
jgi:hypothetical protein